MADDRSRHRRGYSLFELVMTLALAAVLLTVGLPSLGRLAADSRLHAEANALFHAVHLARKASVVRRRVVTICPSRDGQSCGGREDWSAGWIMFEEQGSAGHGNRDGKEALLRQHAVHPAVDVTANRNSFSLRSTHLRATNGTLTLCDGRGRGRSRAVIVSYTGRPRVATEDARGRPLECALR